MISAMLTRLDTLDPYPRLTLSAGLHGLVGAVLLLALAVAASRAFDLGPLAPAASFALYAAGFVWIAAGLRRHLPLRYFGPANRTTLARGVAICLLAGLIGHDGPAEALAWPVAAAAAIALVLDGVDGWIARRRQCASPFGARFDMELDAVFLLVLSILALQAGKAGPWVLAIGLMRYLFVLAGLIWKPLTGDLPPSQRRRVVCGFQGAVLVAALMPVVPAWLSGGLIGFALIALSWSFWMDTSWLMRNAATRE